MSTGGIRSIKNFFDFSSGEDYYKPIIIDGVFNGNYIQYESMGDEGREDEDKDKNLSVEEYIHKIKPYLSDLINNHKAHGEQIVQARTK